MVTVTDTRRDLLRRIDSVVSEPLSALVLEIERRERDRYYPSACLVRTIMANVDNAKLTDAEFREFIRNSLTVIEIPEA